MKLLCPKLGTGTQFALAGSSGFSLLTGFLLTIMAGCIAFLGIVWRRGRRRNEDCQGREEEEEEQLHRCDLKKEEREPGCEDWTVIDWKLSYVIQKDAYLNSLRKYALPHLWIWSLVGRYSFKEADKNTITADLVAQKPHSFKSLSNANALRPKIWPANHKERLCIDIFIAYSKNLRKEEVK